MKYRAVLFDFDGVVANSLWFYRHTWEQFIAKSNLPLSSSVFEKEGFFTKSLEQVCQTLKEKYNIELDKQKLIEETIIIEQTLMAEGLECDPTLIPFLEYCKKQNIELCGFSRKSALNRISFVTPSIQRDDTISWVQMILLITNLIPKYGFAALRYSKYNRTNVSS